MCRDGCWCWVPTVRHAPGTKKMAPLPIPSISMWIMTAGSTTLPTDPFVPFWFSMTGRPRKSTALGSFQPDPAYAPQILNVVSLWDEIYNTWVRELNLCPDIFDKDKGYNYDYNPFFDRDLAPIFQATGLQRWIAFFKLPPNSHFSRLTVLEAVEYGWWYAAKLPDNRLATVLASEASTIKQTRSHELSNWLHHLKVTKYIWPALADCSSMEKKLLVCSAPSFHLDRTAGHGWLAVGDAASAYDPISSQGIYKALSDGLEAGKAIASSLDGDPKASGEVPLFYSRSI